MKTSSALILTLTVGAVLAVSPARSLEAQGPPQNPGPPEWVAAHRHDTSKRLKDTIPTPPVSTRGDFEVKKGKPAPQGGQADQAVQQSFTSALSASTGSSFDGVGEGNPQFSFNVTYAPPDTTGEAGLTQFVQWVNASFAVFDKASGTKLYGPAGGNTLWAGFGGDCESHNDGDPIVQYDQLADRWIMTQFTLRDGAYLQCVAVSQTSDALGAWHRYAFSYTEFPDYPKLAVWPDAYYITFNMFGATGSNFTGGRVCVYDRAKMLNGLPASQVCVQNPSYYSQLPSDLEGKTLPPAGSPNYVLAKGGSSSLSLWKFKPNFVTPASSTFTGPTSITVAAYSQAGTIPQPGTTQRLDSLSDRLMYRLGYRNLGTREALTVNHAVVAGTTTGVRWYELDITGGVPSVRQQSTYSPNADHRWMGSVAMDHVGNIALGFSASSSTVKPSIRFAGREAIDPLNTLSTELSLQVGGGSQLPNLGRWGDYSSMSVDPVDDCTFWFTSEYLQVSGTFNWSTRIGSFKFASCTGDTEPPPPTPNFSLSATPSSRTITVGQTTTFDATVTSLNGYAGNGSFSVSGLPANTLGSFSPPGFSSGSGSSTLTITTAANTPTGSFQVTITAADSSGTPTQSTIVTLNVNPAPVPDFTLSVSPTNRTIKRGKSGTYAVTVTPSGGFNQTVTFSRTGCPSNTTCAFSPGSVNGGGSSTLTIATTSSTPRGTYTLVITGTSQSKTRSASVSLKVQ